MKGGAYIPLGICDSKSRMKAMLSKLVKGQENYLKEIRENISGLT